MSLNDPHWGRGGSDDNEEKKSAPDKENRSDTDRKDERGQNGFENKEAGKRKMKGMIWIVSGMNLTVLWAEC